MSTSTTTVRPRVVFADKNITCTDEDAILIAALSALAALASALEEPTSAKILAGTGFFPLMVNGETCDSWIEGLEFDNSSGTLILRVEYITGSGPDDTALTEVSLELFPNG